MKLRNIKTGAPMLAPCEFFGLACITGHTYTNAITVPAQVMPEPVTRNSHDGHVWHRCHEGLWYRDDGKFCASRTYEGWELERVVPCVYETLYGFVDGETTRRVETFRTLPDAIRFARGF